MFILLPEQPEKISINQFDQRYPYAHYISNFNMGTLTDHRIVIHPTLVDSLCEFNEIYGYQGAVVPDHWDVPNWMVGRPINSNIWFLMLPEYEKLLCPKVQVMFYSCN